jgi:Tol biopolymer transport system component
MERNSERDYSLKTINNINLKIMKRKRNSMNKSMFKSLLKTIVVILGCQLGLSSCGGVKLVSYSTISVPEEGGINFVKLTTDDDGVASPGFWATTKSHITTDPTKSGVSWYRYPVIDVSADGEKVGYINYKNETTNVMIKSAFSGGSSTQRTFRTDVRGFAFSPDGEKICYTEFRDGNTGIFMMNAQKGTTVQRISPTGSSDNGPSMTKEDRIIFFDRYEGEYNYSLWSYDTDNGLFSNYSHGYSPCVDPSNDQIIYCTRYTYDDNEKGNIVSRKGLSLLNSKQAYVSNLKTRRSEIWKLDISKGTEELLLSDKMSSFSSPKVSPDGKWILITGANTSNNGIWNTNLFVIRSDGTNFTQLTYHPGNDMSAVWSPGGQSIYFVSQRGTEKGTYNVWKMNFPL